MRKKISQTELIVKELIKSQLKSRADLDAFKRKISKKFNLPTLSNIKLLKAYHDFCKKKSLKPKKNIENILIKRRIRSLSGIVVVSVLTKPYPCPGKCLYCPLQKKIPKSYLENEPAVMRAILNKFDPYRQTQTRIKALKLAGHPTDKIELRIIGGTWSYYPKKYQTWFIKRCFDACNNKEAKNLLSAQKRNEKAKHRIIGISIETRPDFINKEEIKRLRKLGITMVELGVQSIYDDVLEKNLRGHKVKDTIIATKLLKDAGFKVLYQVMPNLLGSNLKRDERMFKEIFNNPDFQPNYLKIYPTAILKEAPLYKLWKEGKYRPYTEKQLKSFLKKIKKLVPYYVRIQRVIRDIPSSSVVVGPTKISNLRQILAKEIEKEGWRCKCIRCREVRENYQGDEKLYLFRQDYNASGGKEIFLSFESENQKRLYSLLRLRIPSKEAMFSVLKNAAIIREVHTYGRAHPLNKKDGAFLSPQHKGLGKKLIKKAEKIAKEEFGLSKMAVISGIGVREYYRRLGYRLKDTYMVKKL